MEKNFISYFGDIFAVAEYSGGSNDEIRLHTLVVFFIPAI